MMRVVAVVLTVARFVAIVLCAGMGMPARGRAATFSCNGGSDGDAGTLSGVYNSYYKPPNGTISAGATSIDIGTIDTSAGGANTAIAVGDELLLIQMQDGSFTYANDATYGSGASIGNAGLYEYVQVATLAGTTAGIVGAGAGSGLINSYTESVATGTHGQQTYQIVRVPQYLTATLSSTFRAAYWDGKTGGVAALDVASTLNLGGATIYATGDGFRGGGFDQASTSPSTALNSDYVASATMNGTNPSTNPPADGFKGEGIFGTPDYTFGYTVFTTPSTPSTPTVIKATSGNGYPGGDVAMGAPGNAGGGGTDMNPSTNDSNSGGGGGSNAGNGGNGGYPWSTQYTSAAHEWYSQDVPGLHTAGSYGAVDAAHNPDIGGRGATAIATAGRALMGGGGGAGSNNNASGPTYGSSGGVGGGVVLLRIADTSGSAATIHADGTVGLAPDNDGGGGGGAGGTVIVTSPNAFTGITATADGAAGTVTAQTNKSAHGPGGGGGGGIVYSSSPVTATVAGGANGTTDNGKTGNTADPYGSTPGTSGMTQNGTYSYTSVPGVPSGAECYSSGGSGNATIYTGPADPGDGTYTGAAHTGSYDGLLTASNNNDFTAASMDLTNASATPTNTGTVAGTWIGSTFTFSSAPTIQIPHEMYYVDTRRRDYHMLTLAAQAPALPGSWTVQVCPDNGSNAPVCTTSARNRCSRAADQNTWDTVAASSVGTNTAQYCYYSGGSTPGQPQTVKYWTVYTPASGTYTTFARYDALITVDDDQASPAENKTHDEIYAGFIPITKSSAIVTNGCPAGVTPPGGGLCPGGVIRYTLDFRNVMAGAGLGDEGQLLGSFLTTKAGTLVISDVGNATFTNGAGANNETLYTNGLASLLVSANNGGYTTCSATAGSCGTSIASTTYAGNTLGSTSFAATVGGSLFQLTPPGYAVGTHNAAQGTITFAVTVK